MRIHLLNRFFRIFCFLVLTVSILYSGIPHHFLKSGLDNTFVHGLDEFKNMKLVVFSNHSSLDSYGRHILDILKTDESITIKKAYIFRRNEWESYWRKGLLLQLTDDFVEFRYKNDDEFTLSDFRGVDKIVFDMQHTGFLGDPVIPYLRIAMRIANRLKIPITVLDRPVFYDRNNIFGPVNKKYGNLPLQYGLTLGELAEHFSNIGLLPKQLLTVIPLVDWEYAVNPEEYDYLWQNQNSHLESAWDADFYPLSKLLDASTLDWEKDTLLSNFVIYASWLDADFLIRSISEEYPEFKSLTYSMIKKDSVDIKGIVVKTIPNFSKYELIITIMRSARVLYPKEFYVKTNYSKILFASSDFADIINKGREIKYIFYYWLPEQNDYFIKRNALEVYKYLELF